MPTSLRVALISAIPLQGFTLLVGGRQFQMLPLELPCYDSSHQQTQCMGYSNCHICQSQYIFGDQGNEYQVTSQTWWTQTLVKTPLITWSTEPTIKSLVVNLDPVLSSPWNVWEFPFPQWTVTQVHSLDPFGEALGKSLCIAEFFALELSHLFSQWYQVWKLKTGQETTLSTSLNLRLVHSGSILTMYIKQCLLAARLFCPSGCCGLLTTP